MHLRSTWFQLLNETDLINSLTLGKNVLALLKLSTSCLLIFADFFSHQNLPDLFKSNTLFTSLAR